MAANRRVEVQAVFSAPGASDVGRVRGNFNVSVFASSGTPTFSVSLQRSPDNGATWREVSNSAGTGAYTEAAEERGFEPANYYLYRFNCTSVTGGEVTAEINR